MYKQFSFRGEVVVDDIVKIGDIHTSGGDISDYHHLTPVSSELFQIDFASRRIQGAVNTGARNSGL